jgi:glutamate-ammonia-ligase adenylyltransferase
VDALPIDRRLGVARRIVPVMTDSRRRMERELQQPGGRHLELKVGRGGLADVDFAVQMIQIRDGAEHAGLRVPGTRAALGRLRGHPVSSRLTPAELDDLESGYLFLRRLELYTRLDLDAGASAVPPEPARLEVLGRRLGLPAPAGESLEREFARVTARVREIHDAVLARL